MPLNQLFDPPTDHLKLADLLISFAPGPLILLTGIGVVEHDLDRLRSFGIIVVMGGVFQLCILVISDLPTSGSISWLNRRLVKVVTLLIERKFSPRTIAVLPAACW